MEAMVREQAIVGTTVVAAHRCTDGERRSVHVVLEREGTIAGVLVSDLGDEQGRRTAGRRDGENRVVHDRGQGRVRRFGFSGDQRIRVGRPAQTFHGRALRCRGTGDTEAGFDVRTTTGKGH